MVNKKHNFISTFNKILLKRFFNNHGLTSGTAWAEITVNKELLVHITASSNSGARHEIVPALPLHEARSPDFQQALSELFAELLNGHANTYLAGIKRYLNSASLTANGFRLRAFTNGQTSDTRG